MQAASRSSRQARLVISRATREDNTTDKNLSRRATLDDSSDTEAAGTHTTSDPATSSHDHEQPADAIELSDQQAALPPLAKVAAAAVLISPFFFWGTSMVGMKVRYGLDSRCAPTAYGVLPCSSLCHLSSQSPVNRMRSKANKLSSHCLARSIGVLPTHTCIAPGGWRVLGPRGCTYECRW